MHDAAPGALERHRLQGPLQPLAPRTLSAEHRDETLH